MYAPWGRLLLKCLPMIPPPGIQTLHNLFLWEVCRSSVSLLTSRIQRKWWDVLSKIRLWETATSFFLPLTLLPDLLWWSKLLSCELPYGQTHMAKNWERPPASRVWGPGASVWQPTRNHSLPTATWASLEVTPSTEPSDDLSLADTWIVLLRNLELEDPTEKIHRNCDITHVVALS